MRRGPSGRLDANHDEIVRALRKLGCSVLSLAPLGNGAPDLLVGLAAGRRNMLLELKDGRKPPSARQLTADEHIFHLNWRGQIDIVHSIDEALAVLGIN